MTFLTYFTGVSFLIILQEPYQNTKLCVLLLVWSDSFEK